MIKSVLSICPTCRRYSGQCLSQQIASLPTERLTLDYHFEVTGIDFAGSIKVIPWKGRGVRSTKGYISIFVCFATRAVHIEIMSDLSTKAFIAAFDRFFNRRNLPKKICSDNATNFQGAERELKQIFSEKTESFKSIKEGRVLGGSALTFPEHSTLATHIERCLNSRPVCIISLDSRDSIPPPQGHQKGTLPPASNTTNTSKTYKQQWTLILAMRNSFWIAWKKEVLQQLIQTNKWKFPQRNLKVGDVVILKEIHRSLDPSISSPTYP